MGNNQQRVKKLRHAIDCNDKMALERLIRKGIDINMAIDDTGNTPLTLAIQRNQCDTVSYLVTAKCDVERRSCQQFSALEILLMNLAHTEDQTYLNILQILLQAGAESISDAVMETIFPMIHHNQELVLKLSRIIAQYAQPPHDIIALLSHVIVQYNNTECFWTLLENGADLCDIWPNSCDQRYFLPPTEPEEGTINMYLTTICGTSNTEFAQMCIQAANSLKILKSIIYFILVYPVPSAGSIKTLLKTLIIAGYKLSDFLLLHMGEQDKDIITWYHEYKSQPKTLAHLSRLCIRNNMSHNVIYGSKHLPLPQTLQSYVCLEDIVGPRLWPKNKSREQRQKKKI